MSSLHAELSARVLADEEKITQLELSLTKTSEECVSYISQIDEAKEYYEGQLKVKQEEVCRKISVMFSLLNKP